MALRQHGAARGRLRIAQPSATLAPLHRDTNMLRSLAARLTTKGGSLPPTWN
jgi:hypothetical protein